MTPRNAPAPATEHVGSPLAAVYEYLRAIGRKAAEDAAAADADGLQPPAADQDAAPAARDANAWAATQATRDER
jgi:hypothetical protein